MKKILVLAAFCLAIQTVFSQEKIGFQFKISKPYCVFNFLQAATNDSRTSQTLQEFIVEKTSGDKEFVKLKNDFLQIQLDYQYRRDQIPEKRRRTRTTHDLVEIALVQSNSIAEFRDRIIGVFPNNDLQELIRLMNAAEVYYDRLIWNDQELKLEKQRIALEKYTAQCSESFTKINRFYNSCWLPEMPFTVAIYPIPGAKGNSTATPHANSLCIGVLTDETDHVGRVGVILHEMCHVLYDEQPAAFEHQIDQWFAGNQSAYKSFAYSFFDEGLATALGNGWAYKSLKGELDPNPWYDNEYINGFGKALYPIVEEYITANKQIDKEFVDRAIDIFGKTFPNSITDYAVLINKVAIYNDADGGPEIDGIMNTVGTYFQMTSSWFSSPILDPAALEQLKTSEQTQLIINDHNNETNFKELKKIFPELSKVKLAPNTIYAFFDKLKRPVILLNVSDQSHLDLLLKEMESKKNFDQTKIVQN